MKKGWSGSHSRGGESGSGSGRASGGVEEKLEN